ncbi:hypothetical protein ACMY46_02675 [Bartonella bacilliformis]|uniref:hypothetical protein n=1 Tax=Bartonella bacilliformis TaxID=774 RepID=UPI00049ED476|nr:hypothetical protein [Bartonella bacilliformis]KEG16388.1 hypothetical protein H705_00253 [Bartonella bacilliformis Cond044]
MYISSIQRQNSNVIIVQEKPSFLVDETPLPIRPKGNDYVEIKLPENLLSEPIQDPNLVNSSLEQKVVNIPMSAVDKEHLDEAEEVHRRLLVRVIERRLAKMEAALDSDPAISLTFNSNIAFQSQTQNNNSQKATLESLFGQSAMKRNALFEGENSVSDPNLQAQKIAFLSQSSDADIYLKNTRQEAIKASTDCLVKDYLSRWILFITRKHARD